MSELDIEKLKVLNPKDYREEGDKFIEWFTSAQPRSKYIYYVGLHLHESLSSEYVRKIAWDYACEGRIYLYCKRDPRFNKLWLFMAEKASRKIPSLIPNREAKN